MLCHQCGSQVAAQEATCQNCGATLKRSSRRLELRSDGLKRMTQQLRAVDADRFFPPGEVLSERFELDELVGKGPFGEVYRAEDTLIDAEVAVKVFRPEFIENPRHQEQFLRTARTARTMTQNNVVRLHDGGVHKDHAWVSMQALEGLTLGKVIEMRRAKGENFSLEELEPIVSQITLAIGHINREFPHGDLKPNNVIFLPELIKVTDHFLLAGLDTAMFCERLSESTYLAPELHTPSDAVDARCDVYSLGVMIGEMIFGADYTPGAQDVSSPRFAAVDALCRRATAFDPAERYDSVEALSEDFVTLVDTGRLLHTDAGAVEPVGLSTPPAAPAGNASADPLLEETPRDIAEPPEEDVATREYERDGDDPGLDDVLATNEVHRDELPPPPDSKAKDPKAAAEPTKTAVETPPRRKSGGRKKDDEAGFPTGVFAVALLAVVALIGSFVWMSNKKAKKHVEIGDRQAAAEREEGEADDGASADEPAEDQEPAHKELTAAHERAEKALLAARGQAIGAAKEAEASPSADEDGEDAADEDDDGARASASDKRATGAAKRRGSSRSKKQKKAPSKATNCKAGMVLVKSRKGNFCIDAYEYPARGAKPQTGVSWFKAQQTCKSNGKRLCRLTEWRRSCGSRYPYGRKWNSDRCNTVDEDEFERELAAAGSFSGCRSWTGAYDMTGNVHEWVAEQRIAGGGFDSGPKVASCSYSSPKAAGSSAPNIGFRCCADAE